MAKQVFYGSKPVLTIDGVEIKGFSNATLSFKEQAMEETISLSRWFNESPAAGMDHNKGCQHKWQKYNGFREAYEFCECGAKR